MFERELFMKNITLKENNKGFSLVELVVIVAIMSLSIGVLSLSVSLVTGSQAKKAFEKVESQLDEVKTGSMSRFNETLQIMFLSASSGYDETTGSGIEQDQSGFYAIKEITTLAADTSEDPDHPKADSQTLGTEQVFLADDRVELTVWIGGTGYVIANDGGSVVFAYERATGLFDEAVVLDSDGNEIAKGIPEKFSAKSGMKTYTMKFVPETGKHIREDS